MMTTAGKGPNSFSSEVERPASGEREPIGSWSLQTVASDKRRPRILQSGWPVGRARAGGSRECTPPGAQSTEGPVLPVEGCLPAPQEHQDPSKRDRALLQGGVGQETQVLVWGRPSPLGHPCPHQDDVGLNQMCPKLCRSCFPLLE